MSLAIEHIAEEGTEKLSLRALAREAGVSATAPYRHFPTKKCLLAALATRGFDDLYERKVKVLYGAILEFVSRAQSQLPAPFADNVYNLRRASTLIVQTVKEVKHLRKNLILHMNSPNVYIRREYDPREQRRLAHRLHRLIADDQPYTFLYAPLATRVLDRKIVMVEPDGSYAPVRASRSGDVFFHMNRWRKLAHAPEF